LYAGGAKQEPDNIIGSLSEQLGMDEPQEIGCWPDNWQALQVFRSMSTQWTVAYGGYVGLRYEALQPVFEACGIKKKARAEMFHSLRIMENEALSVINER
jgi:hypothetical protein